MTGLPLSMPLRALFALLAVILAACGPKPEEDRFVRTFFDHIRAGELETIQDDLAPSLKTPGTAAQLEQIRSTYIPQQAPQDAMRINWSFNTIYGGDSTATFVHRYDYPDRALVVTTSTRTRPNGPTLVEGFHVNVTLLNDEVRATQGFSFANATNTQLAFFAAMLLSLALMLLAFFGVIFTAGFKRKWVFAIVALLGGPIFVMNWTTGEWAPNFAVGLLNIGALRGLGPLDPWILKFHVPVGALICLSLLWPKWMGLGAATESEPAPKP